MPTAPLVPFVLDPAWAVGGRPHGGHLLGKLALLGLDETHPHPVAVSAHFLAPPLLDAATEVEVERLRTGRTVAASRLQLRQGDQVKVTALLTAGRLDPDSAPSYEDHTRPWMPPPEDCPAADPVFVPGVESGPMKHVDLRHDPTTMTSVDGPPPTARGVDRAWMRPREGGPVELTDLIMYADMLQPVTFGFGNRSWTPTVELTFLLRAVPEPGWLQVEHRAAVMQDGWVDHDCRIWDGRGRLVAQSRQLNAVRA